MKQLDIASMILNDILDNHTRFPDALKKVFQSSVELRPLRGDVAGLIGCELRHDLLFAELLKGIDGLDEKDKRIRKISTDVTFPLEDKYKKFINDSIQMLTLSQIEEEAEKYNLRPGMGLSAVQVGILKRIFVIVYEYEEGKFENYIFINPKITSNSEELVYVDGGEGCLSVNREIEGIVPRYARINVEYYDIDGNKQKMRLRDELSIVFQHELDHLNGILFFDHIDKKNPYKNQNNMRAI